MADAFFIPASHVERDFDTQVRRYTRDDVVNAASLPLEGEAGWIVDDDGNTTWVPDGVRDVLPAERIRALRSEAEAAWDTDMVDLCTRALHGDLVALRACGKAVRAAEAAAS